MPKRMFKSNLLGFMLFGILLMHQALSAMTKYPMPEPKYKVRIEQSVMVPMPDGIRLSTDIYFPEGAGEKLPVILMRTPYNKNTMREAPFGDLSHAAHMFAGQGFVVAVQDCRGRFESEGEYIISLADTDDGHNAVTWAATQPWSNGNVGTYGCSYLGENQVQMAKTRNPHLKAMIPQAAGGGLGSGGNRYRYFAFITGGAFELAQGFGWCYQYGSKVFFRPPPGTSRPDFLEVAKFFNPAPAVQPLNYKSVWKSLPLINMMKEAGGLPTDFEDFVSHEPADPWWDQFGYVKDTDRFDVPALHVNSWYDYGVADSLYLFNLFKINAESDTAKANQFAIISPTSHCGSEGTTENTIVGERNVGDAQFNYWEIYIKWFEHWLSGIDNGITSMPKVQIYTMGKNEWRGENEWPLQTTEFTKYYLHSNGYANSRFGTGTLSPEKSGKETPDRFVYDPKTPVPSRGGPVCCTGTPDAPPGSFDQAEVETRNDVLVYTTPPLKRGIEVTGPLHAVLYVSSSAKDTDFTAKLVDVYPDGTAYSIQEGILRARYRDGFDRKVWMKPGEVYKMKIDTQATSNYFKPGHRIRLEISSSNFPRFDRNLNTGGNNFDETEWVIAKNTVHHSQKYPSHIVLPVIAED